MVTDLLLGYGFVVLGALCGGAYALPHKFAKGYAWENTWGGFFLGAMIIVPAVAAYLLLKAAPATWMQTWNQAGPLYVIAPAAFGFLWGCGTITFGIGVSRIGLSLGYSIVMGLCALVGSMLPLLTQHADKVLTAAGLVILGGIMICVAGIGICGYAGILRERWLSAKASGVEARANTMVLGLLICVASGIFSSCCNLAFSYGNTISDLSSREFGNAPWIATLSVWLLVFWGGFLAAGSYSVFQLFKNATWKNFVGPNSGRNLALVSLMAVLHFAALFFYGIGAHYLGELGTSIGWSVNMSGTLIVANAMGFLTAEWKGASSRSRVWICAGLALLILGMITLGLGNQLQAN